MILDSICFIDVGRMRLGCFFHVRSEGILAMFVNGFLVLFVLLAVVFEFIQNQSCCGRWVAVLLLSLFCFLHVSRMCLSCLIKLDNIK